MRSHLGGGEAYRCAGIGPAWELPRALSGGTAAALSAGADGTWGVSAPGESGTGSGDANCGGVNFGRCRSAVVFDHGACSAWAAGPAGGATACGAWAIGPAGGATAW